MLISIVTPTFNEEENILNLYLAVKKEIEEYFSVNPLHLRYEHIFIDNKSTDKTRLILEKIANNDKNVKVILNVKNYGQHISPYYAFITSTGDAIITLAADFEDPIELIPEMIDKWINNNKKIVCAVRDSSNDNFISYNIRLLYYKLISVLSYSITLENFSGYGLFDKSVREYLSNINEPVPYFRALVLNTGVDFEIIKYKKILRTKGMSSNNFESLLDTCLLGVISIGNRVSILLIYLQFIFFAFILLNVISYLVGIINVNSLLLSGLLILILEVIISIVMMAIISYKLQFISAKINSKNSIIIEKTINI